MKLRKGPAPVTGKGRDFQARRIEGFDLKFEVGVKRKDEPIQSPFANRFHFLSSFSFLFNQRSHGILRSPSEWLRLHSMPHGPENRLVESSWNAIPGRGISLPRHMESNLFLLSKRINLLSRSSWFLSPIPTLAHRKRGCEVEPVEGEMEGNTRLCLRASRSLEEILAGGKPPPSFLALFYPDPFNSHHPLSGISVLPFIGREIFRLQNLPLSSFDVGPLGNRGMGWNSNARLPAISSEAEGIG